METISPPSTEMCAAEILEVIPAIMRTIRTQMRGNSTALPSVVHFRALAYINRHADADVSGVAAHIGLMLPSASKLVQVLIARGYVARSADPGDRRRTLLRPTAKGRKAVEAARGATRAYLANLLRDCDGPTRTTMIGAMRALRPIFQDAPANGEGQRTNGPSSTSAATPGRGRRRTTTRTIAS